MNWKIRRLLLQTCDGLLMITFVWICMQAHKAGATWFEVTCDAALGLLLDLWIEQILWWVGRTR